MREVRAMLSLIRHEFHQTQQAILRGLQQTLELDSHVANA